MSNLVRESAKFIASKANHVKIDNDAVLRLAIHLNELGNGKAFNAVAWTGRELFPKVADEKAIAWIFAVDLINFSFWHLDEQKTAVIHYGGKDNIGQMFMIAAINRALDRGIPITDPNFYAHISEDELKKVFAPDSGDEMPMLKERLDVLHESGRILIEKFGGSFVNCVKQANGSAQALLKIVVDNFPAFRDEVADYCGRKVAFFKRAQLMVSDIWSCFEGAGLGAFSDIDTLTMFADYRIPQVLVHFGVLKYSDELNRLLAETHVFKNGDAMEVEIRGCTIYAVDILHEKMRELSSSSGINTDGLSVALIDYYLWSYRRLHAAELQSTPFHHVRCIYY